jgi:hypothetical protein
MVNSFDFEAADKLIGGLMILGARFSWLQHNCSTDKETTR